MLERRIVANVIAEAAERETGGLPDITIAGHFEGDSFIGEFDPASLSEAIKAITDDVRATISPKAPQPISITMVRDANHATIEWRGGRFNTRNSALPHGCGTIHTELATKIIEAQGGELVCAEEIIRVTLPLSNK